MKAVNENHKHKISIEDINDFKKQIRESIRPPEPLPDVAPTKKWYDFFSYLPSKKFNAYKIEINARS